ncbi:YdbL family protein [Candidatus Methylacidithermus pantelleriae]|uniref:YdbL family protein n=1 Tax=Candidatus Methylacidithermus pantelleriae TaxID=2744239 RepID=UPI001F32B2DA|nr:DUF1318 domain-containing protein [Candidatus Methylacidithermus pantelleriae]
MKRSLKWGILQGVPLLVLSWGCSPTVKVVTPEPVRIHIRMDVEVKTPKLVAPKPVETVAERRRMRMGEVQQLKNARVIGENRDGFLSIVQPPKDPAYAAYAKKIVEEENRDRLELYLANAKTQSRALEVIQEEYAQRWRERAFPGEWIQLPDGTWKQK